MIVNMADVEVGKFLAWTLYIDPNQTSTGACYAKPKREDVKSIERLTSEGFLSLRQLIPKWYEAVKHAYGAPSYNFEFVGNNTSNFRLNLIPLYPQGNEKEGLEKHPNHPLFTLQQLMEVKRHLEEHILEENLAD